MPPTVADRMKGKSDAEVDAMIEQMISEQMRIGADSSDDDDGLPPPPPRGQLSRRRAAGSPADESSAADDSSVPLPPPKLQASRTVVSNTASSQDNIIAGHEDPRTLKPLPSLSRSPPDESSAADDSGVPLPPPNLQASLTLPGDTALSQDNVITGHDAQVTASAAVVIQKHARGRQERARFSANETRKARQDATLLLQSARRRQLAQRRVLDQMVAGIYAFCGPDDDGCIGRNEYMYCKHH